MYKLTFSALVGGEWSTSCPDLLKPDTNWCRVDPKADLDDVEKRKFLPHWDTNSETSVVQPVASRYTDCAILAHSILLYVI
jgi:hypothetical protein